MWPFPRAKPECPVDPEQRAWVDGRFRWLEEQFGRDVPARAAVVLPTAEYFPDPFAGTHADAKVMLDRLAGYMNVDPARLELFVYSEATPMPLTNALGGQSRTAGLYIRDEGHGATDRPPASIGIEEGQLADPMSLVATLAHEIGHEILLGEARVGQDESDHEPLTDLLTVFLGLGVFTANATIRDRGWSGGGWAGWNTSRHGYLDQRMLGYALARFATARGETNPPWARHVRADVASPLAKGLRFLKANA